MNATSHLKYTLLGGLGLFATGLLAGIPLERALPLAILLACPLMMVFMMRGMHGGSDSGQSHGDHQPHDQHSHH